MPSASQEGLAIMTSRPWQMMGLTPPGLMPGVGGGIGGTATPGNLTGAPAWGYSGAYGGVPQVPSPQSTQGAAVSGNVAALPGLEDLAGQLNAFNTQQAAAPYIANLPGYQQMIGQASGNIEAGLQGQLPNDVVRLIGQQAAERGASVGTNPSTGPGNFNAAYLQSLGLTSLQREDIANQQLTGAIARTPVGPQFDPATFFVTPQQQQEAQWIANLMNASPIPAQAAAANLQALLAGRSSAQSPGGPGYWWASAPSGTGSVPSLPTYGGMAPAAGRNYDPEALSYGYNPDTWDQWMNEWDQGTPIGETASIDQGFPGMPDYPNVPGFELPDTYDPMAPINY